MRKLKVIIAILVLALAITACSPPQGNSSGVESKDVQDNILRLVSDQEVDSLDPQLGNSNYTTIVTDGMYEGLVRFHDGEYLPGVAESWEISEDGLVYTFHLRSDSLWSDGKQVTAEDFVDSLQLLVSRPEAVGYSYLASDIKNASFIINGELDKSELGVKALDSQTLEITLESPTSYFLSLVSFPTLFPLRADAYENFGESYGSSVDKVITNGPFLLTEIENQSKYVLSKNPDYWNADAINLEGVEIYIIPDKSTQMSMFEAGEIDVVSIANEYVEKYRSSGEAKTFDDGSVFFIQISNEGMTEETGRIINNQNFKFAVSNAIDRTGFVNAVFKNGSQPLNKQVIDSVIAYDGKTFGEVFGDYEPLHPVTVDEELAKEYLDKALEELGYESVEELPELDFLISDREADRITAEYIQDAVKRTLGVQLNIRTLTFAQKYETMQTFKYDFGWAGWGPDYNDANTYLDMFTSHGYSAGYIGWASDEFDALIEKASNMPDGKDRAEVLNSAHQLILEEGPIIPVYAGGAAWTAKDNIKNYSKNFVGAENDYIFVEKQ